MTTIIPCPCCAPEKGAYIRARVPVSTKKISEQLRKQEDAIIQEYPGCRAFVIPKLQQPEKLEVELSGASDKDNVEQYVAATIPETAKFNARRAAAYLVSRLPKTQLRGGYKQLRVLRAACKGVLSFEEISINYSKQGLVLLKGENRDWPGQSNGAGKSNALSILPIIWMGETIKGQKNDAWANERTDGPAEGVLTLRDGAGRKIEIKRGRRPHKIALYIDGKDVSEGMTGKGKYETQGLIEQVTGFDLRMLKNSVYIDQTIANGFVFGTQKDRMDLVNKLCSLERFDEALKAARVDFSRVVTEKAKLESQVELLASDIERYEVELQEAGATVAVSWKKEQEKVEAAIRKLVEENAALATSKGFYETMQRDLDDIEAEIAIEAPKRENLWAEAKKYAALLDRAEKLLAKGYCPACGRKADAAVKSDVQEYRKKQEESEQARQKSVQAIASLQTRVDKKRRELEKYEEESRRVSRALDSQRERLAEIEEAVKEEAARNAKIEDKTKALKSKLTKTQRILKAVKFCISESDVEIELYSYAGKAFSRNGMPMYLAASLCPMLNRAAEEYSETFTSGMMKIQFSVVDGEFDVSVLNMAGSENSEGQSVGESALAGLVAAFALREAAPKTNILILDEPGHGLDEVGAKQFAKGLVQLKDRWPTIILTTHNRVIEEELEGEATVWTVVKKKGISHLQAVVK